MAASSVVRIAIADEVVEFELRDRRKMTFPTDVRMVGLWSSSGKPVGRVNLTTIVHACLLEPVSA